MLNNSVALLKAGELVAFPTETVYGLGADANNPVAIEKVFQVKGRPADHPVIVHIADAQQLTAWAREIPPSAWVLAEHFWPGPLTLILYKQPHVSALVTGGQDTIGIRIPNHPLTLELLSAFGSGIIGPSANKYGHVSPTTAQHVENDLGSDVAAILDGGACTVGIESTIIDLTSGKPCIMRVGAISAEQIAHVLNCKVTVNTNSAHKIRTPGSHAAHYAPLTPAYMMDHTELLKMCKQLQKVETSFSVLSFQPRPASLPNTIFWQQVTADPITYAHNLYANLRKHDQLNNATILIEAPPNDLAWLAVSDRLQRACKPLLTATSA